jgi:hypothetical protein
MRAGRRDSVDRANFGHIIFASETLSPQYQLNMLGNLLLGDPLSDLNFAVRQ